MQRRLRTAPIARRQFGQIATYIATNFATSVLENYIKRWAQFKETVRKNPLQYPFYKEVDGKHYRKAVLSNLTVVLFTFDDQTIYIDAIYDARSDWQGKM